MVLKLYQSRMSPPVRSVLMLAEILKLDMELIEVDLLKKEHLTPQYLAINPLHTVPTLQDDDFYLWDSHAIVMYLMDKYATSDLLYPQDIAVRAIVNRFLFFDGGFLYPILKELYYPIIYAANTKEEHDHSEPNKKIGEAYKTMESMLKDSDYLVGKQLTIADICCISSVSCLDIMEKIDKDIYPNLHKWYTDCQKTDWYKKGNKPGLKELSKMIHSSISSN